MSRHAANQSGATGHAPPSQPDPAWQAPEAWTGAATAAAAATSAAVRPWPSQQPAPPQPHPHAPHEHPHAHLPHVLSSGDMCACAISRKRKSHGNGMGGASAAHASADSLAAAAAAASNSSTPLDYSRLPLPSHASSSSSDPSSAAASYATCPLTLGLEVSGAAIHPIIPRGTRLPCTSTQLFSTYADRQHYVSIMVYQGQRASTTKNLFLGRLDLLGIRPAPRGVPRIEVTFSLDTSGSLRVTAHESLYGSVQALTVQSQFEPNRPALSWRPDLIAALLADAEHNRADDERLMALTAAKARLEQYCYGLVTSLEQPHTRTLLTPAEAQLIQQQHESCVRWLAAHAPDATQFRLEDLERKLDEMQRVCQPIVIKLFESTSAHAPAITSAPSDTQFATVQSQHRNRLSSGASSDITSFPSPTAPAEQKLPGEREQEPAAAASGLAFPSDPSAAPMRAHSNSGGLLASPNPALAGLLGGQLSPPLDDVQLRTPPPGLHLHVGTHASPDSYLYAGPTRFHSFAATSSSPLLSSLAPPSGWAHPWTHPSLLSSPILSSTYHQNGDSHGGGAGLTSAVSATSSSANGHHNGLHTNIDESVIDVMDFLTFPNSATLSLTHVNVADDSAPSLSARGDASLMQPLPLHALDLGPHMAAAPMQIEVRLRGGSNERQQRHQQPSLDDDQPTKLEE